MGAIDLNCDMGESFGAWTMGSDADAENRLLGQCRLRVPWRRPARHVRYRDQGQGKRRRRRRDPSFFDVWGFGCRMIQGETPEDIEKIVVYQIGALQGVARAVGHRVGHVKAHGTLANLAAVDRATALAIGRAVDDVDRELIYVVMAGTELERAAGELACAWRQDLRRPRL